jgi:hypothetical protein
MQQETKTSSRAERWLGRLLTATAVVGALWWYSWLWLGSHRLLLPSIGLLAVLLLAIWAWLLRARRRWATERVAHLDREMWRSTLPTGAEDAHEHSTDERVV